MFPLSGSISFADAALVLTGLLIGKCLFLAARYVTQRDSTNLKTWDDGAATLRFLLMCCLIAGWWDSQPTVLRKALLIAGVWLGTELLMDIYGGFLLTAGDALRRRLNAPGDASKATQGTG